MKHAVSDEICRLNDLEGTLAAHTRLSFREMAAENAVGNVGCAVACEEKHNGGFYASRYVYAFKEGNNSIEEIFGEAPPVCCLLLQSCHSAGAPGPIFRHLSDRPH